MAERQAPNLINDPHAPLIYATGCGGFAAGHGSVTLTFDSKHDDHSFNPAVMQRVVIGRAVLQAPVLQSLVMQLTSRLQSLSADPLGP